MSQNCSSKNITLGEQQFEIPVISPFGRHKIAKLILKTGKLLPIKNPRWLNEDQRDIFISIVEIGLREAKADLTRDQMEEILDFNNLHEAVMSICEMAGFKMLLN